MKKKNVKNGFLMMLLGLSVAIVSCKKEGCTDPLASNYNKKANHDDGSCLYGTTVDTTITGGTLIVNEDINAPTTWAHQTVLLQSGITVNAALTVNPGVTVIADADTWINVETGGSITAVGTATSPIMFKGETTSAGFWRGIGIESNNPNNRFEYVTVTDGGSYWYWEYANVALIGSGKLITKNSTYNNSENYGFYAGDGTSIPEFTNNTFSNNTGPGLNIEAGHIGMLDEASTYNLSNGADHIFVRGGTLGAVQTWKKTNAPLLMTESVYVNAGLIINAGSNIQFEANQTLEINDSGYLTALGTATAPINISGRFSSAGYWRGIQIESNNPNNKFAYVNIKDGGEYWFYDYSSLVVDGRLEMDNCSINNSNSWGMVVRTSSQILCGGVLQSDAAGVMGFNTISGNGVGPDADCASGGCTILFE